MSISKSILQILALITIFAGLSGYNFMRAAWTAPTATPPGNNVDAPVNTGATSQVKNGGLSLNALTVNGGQIVESLSPVITLRDEDGGDFRFVTNGHQFRIQSDLSSDNIWDTSPLIISASSSPGSDFALFSSEVRASAYCNRSGDNCFTLNDIQDLLDEPKMSVSTYSTKSNPLNSVYENKRVCSCERGDFLTGCSGPQLSDYDTSAIVGTNACYGESGDPVCTCLTTSPKYTRGDRVSIFSVAYAEAQTELIKSMQSVYSDARSRNQICTRIKAGSIVHSYEDENFTTSNQKTGVQSAAYYTGTTWSGRRYSPYTQVVATAADKFLTSITCKMP